MPEIAVQDLQAVGADALDEVVIMAVVTLSKALKKSTVNLRAPILFNPFKGLAKQVILEKQAYAVKQPLFADG
jgi:flagellar assembly factor FliW